jgi:hypothetical protein
MCKQQQIYLTKDAMPHDPYAAQGSRTAQAFLRPLAAYSHPILPNTLSAKIHLKSTLSSFILRNCSLGIE